MKRIYQIDQKLFLFAAVGVLFLVCSCRDTSNKSKVTPRPATETTTTPTETTTTPTSTNVAGVNPAHGQPGHRCDIAVGAPLNSAGNSSIQSSSPVRDKSATTLNVNPAHGQPGHRCDIAVGAPLE